MVKNLKKIFSIFLSVVLIALMLVPFVSAVAYPKDVTKEKAETAIEKTDGVIYNAVMALQNTTLKALIAKEIYSSDTLSMLLSGVYGMLSENEAELSGMNIDVSVVAVREALKAYPDVASKLSAYKSWSEVKDFKADWNVNDKDGFVRGVSAIFTPFNDILYTLLCSGSFSLNSIVGIKGGNGYETAIVPTLKSFGLNSITDKAVFYADSKNDKGMMVYHLVSDVLGFAEEVLDAPADRLTDVLPGIAYFFNNGGFDKAVSKLLEPLTLQLGKITTFIKIEPLLKLIADPAAMTEQFDINALMGSADFKIAEINLEEFASCGTVSGDTVISDKGACFVVLMRFLIDTLKLNSDKMGELTKGMNTEESPVNIEDMMSKLLAKETDELITMYVSLLTAESGKKNNYQWKAGEFTPTEITYTQNLGEEKFQRVLDGIDELIDEFVAEAGQFKTLEAMLIKQIYSSNTVTSLVSGIYTALQSEELSALSAVLGLNITPSAVANTLTKSNYYSARKSLYGVSSWKALSTKYVYWGFNDGDSKGFAEAVTLCLSPLEPLIKMLLAEGKISLLGIDFYGSDGYNSAVIPLFEALGCKDKTILTYEQYKKESDKVGAIKPLVETLCAFLDRVMKKPVYTITEIAPNLIYFFKNDGFTICIENLLYPVTSLLGELGMGDMISMKDMMGEIDTEKLISELTANMDLGMKLPEMDIELLGTIGTLETMESKRTFDGKSQTVSYVKANQTGVLITILRYFVEVMKAPGNESLITGFMGGGAEGGNDMFATYSAGIGEEMAAMTTDETVEWLYKLFFRERAVKEIKPQDDYLPTIIYEGKKENTALKGFILVVLIVCAGELVFIKNRTRIERFIEDRKLKKKLKDDFLKKSEQEAK